MIFIIKLPNWQFNLIFQELDEALERELEEESEEENIEYVEADSDLEAELMVDQNDIEECTGPQPSPSILKKTKLHSKQKVEIEYETEAGPRQKVKMWIVSLWQFTLTSINCLPSPLFLYSNYIMATQNIRFAFVYKAG